MASVTACRACRSLVVPSFRTVNDAIHYTHSRIRNKLDVKIFVASTQGSLQPGDEKFMRLALEQAQAAFNAGEVPIGAVLVCGSEVVSSGRNMTETERNPLCHAELMCIMSAAKQLQAWRLQDATLYCTVEPCPMCAGAILQARLQRLVYGARQPRLGADGSWVALFPTQQQDQAAQGPTSNGNQNPSGRIDLQAQAAAGIAFNSAVSADEDQLPTSVIRPRGSHPFHPNITVTRGVLEDECSSIMVQFFKRRRQQQKAAMVLLDSDGATFDEGSTYASTDSDGQEG